MSKQSEEIFNAIVNGDKDKIISSISAGLKDRYATEREIQKVKLTADIFNKTAQVQENVEEELEEAAKMSGRDVVSKMKQSKFDWETYISKKGMEAISKKSSWTAKDLDAMLPDYVPGGEIQKLFEGTEKLEEAVSAEDFVKGGNTKATEADVEDIISDVYDSTQLTKKLIKTKAYKQGEKDPDAKNPYKKDTVDYHIWTLASQLELARR